ncbi:MAG: cysteine desulfurase family protein [Bacteroidia bacterium]|nr:cysteine desulfurase family protein [Bacteroidia bacterium]
MQVYLDNAATTIMDAQVIDEMTQTMKDIYGNPSAIHTNGRQAKAVVELARKSIAKILQCHSSEIIFTGSGTEADNMALRCAVNDLGVTHIITSTIEHKAVLDTAKTLERKGRAKVSYVKLDVYGKADLKDLESLTKKHPGSLISLMHANNEIGSLNDVHAISQIARANQCYFHSDTIQTIGHYPIDLSNWDVDFVTCSAHKFHGPKGVGFMYKNKSIKISPMVTGGGQESAMRAGTENVIGITGLSKAFEIANSEIEDKIKAIQALKSYFIQQIREKIKGTCFNGDISPEGGLYTVLNVSLPPSEKSSTLLFQLDINGIFVSGGSACNSGAIGSSHVLAGINHPNNRSVIRFSFSKFTIIQEVDYAIDTLRELI